MAWLFNRQYSMARYRKSTGKYGDQSARRMTTESAKGAILETQVNAALSGHDIGPFEPVETFEGAGYQARCRRCNQTAWVGESGLMYSLLAEQ